MKKQEIQIGSLYLAKVGARTVEVRIEGSLPKGGWNARSTASGKPVRIKDATRLKPVKVAPEEPQRPEAAPAPADQAPEVSDAAPETVPLTQLDREKKQSRSKAAKPAKEKAMSCLDAAAVVLKGNNAPMQCKTMIAVMIGKGLWTTNAPTPAATLYSAILREINTKGDKARFKKTDRGHFALND